jgi:UDP-N-acetylglucosamine--N-acetylmuramyl-(pentapeptide) pyrophosphoryl-undecaprenol N-acetylglucosamine transferase
MGIRLVLLSAGGTGGHLFPAEALAAVLDTLGVETALATDERANEFASNFPEDDVYCLPSATPSGGTLSDKFSAMATLARGVWEARKLIKELRPAAVVGFGGYPTVPPLIAASLLRVPIIIHEQNAVMGRANRFLASRAKLIATAFPHVSGTSDALQEKMIHVGNPVRESVLKAAGRPYPPALKGGKLRILVFGGSQGARIMSEVVPAAIERLPGEGIKRIMITQQAREEDLLKVRAQYARMGIEADVQPFFKDLPTRMADSHLIIARSGASTIAELSVIGRPSILVPLPGSLDQDQTANAKALSSIGAATVIPQSEFLPERLGSELLLRLADPEGLTRAGEAAKSAGMSDSAERLAALVVQIARIPIRLTPPSDPAPV